jgi:hypothetical protein
VPEKALDVMHSARGVVVILQCTCSPHTHLGLGETSTLPHQSAGGAIKRSVYVGLCHIISSPEQSVLWPAYAEEEDSLLKLYSTAQLQEVRAVTKAPGDPKPIIT